MVPSVTAETQAHVGGKTENGGDFVCGGPRDDRAKRQPCSGSRGVRGAKRGGVQSLLGASE